MRLDFLALSPAEESPKSKVQSPKSENGRQELESGIQYPVSSIRHSALAYIPFRYIEDSRQRIEIYRKLAQVTDKPGLDALEQELRDRFGPVPPPLQLLLQVTEAKVLAAERGITVIEVQDDRLMLTRDNDYVMVGSKFPRLLKKQAGARLNEIKRQLLAL